MGKRKFNVINGTLDKNWKTIRKYPLGVQALDFGDKPKLAPPDIAGGAMNVGGAAAAGFATAGPAGAIVGGLGAVLGEVFKRQEEKEQDRIAKGKYSKASVEGLQHMILDPSQRIEQATQAKKGVYATGTEEIEVEKDELVFSKGITGKYQLRADFKGGKTHNQGGEDYEAQEGDVIFPGKDRKKVMKAYKAGDTPSLESMRMSLPKDTTKGTAQEGLDTTDPEKQLQAMITEFKKGDSPITQDMIKQFAAANNLDIAAVQRGKFSNILDLPIAQGTHPFPYTDADTVQDVPIEKPATSVFQENPYPGMQSISERLKQIPPVTAKATAATVPTDPRTEAKFQVDPVQAQLKPLAKAPAFGQDITAPADIELTQDQQKLLRKGERKQERQATITGIGEKLFGGEGKGAGVAGYAAQGFAALSNLFPGETEVQTTPKIQLAKQQYVDTSGSLRERSKISERVQAETARSVSGGNVQNYLANRRMAGLQHLQNLQSIEGVEYARRTKIAGVNIAITNQERLYNAQIAQRDEEINVQNRATAGNIRREGISQLGELGAIISRDKQAKSQQEQSMQLIESLGLYDRLGKIKT